jgi:YVTN family beta-propeller protein
MVPARDGRLLYVANRRSGSISIVDLSPGRVVAEQDVGVSLSDLAATADGRFLLATDEAADQLIVLRCEQDSLELVARLPVGPAPVRVAVSPHGAVCFVASLWSRTLSTVDLGNVAADSEGVEGTVHPVVRYTTPLPFAPREMVLVRDGRVLVVADSFGGRLGVVDTLSGQLVAVRQLPGHNVRGLALDRRGEQLFVSHQLLNSLAETTHNDVHWGVLLTNNLRRLDLGAVLSTESELLERSQMHFLGDPGNATGDPAGVAVTGNGTVVVALAGVDQVAVGEGLAASFHRIPVGRRPTRVVPRADGRRVYVANTFSDSVSVINLDAMAAEAEISLGPAPELSLVDRGELLFYDARLSLDGWYSCHSCHTDGHTNGLLADNLGDGTFGAPKRVLSLLGTGDTGPWAWNGSKPTLADQIRISIRSTMQGPAPIEEQIKALEAYLRSLKPPPPIVGVSAGEDAQAVARGAAVFHRQRCVGCHRESTYTAKGTYDVGLDDGRGASRFNPPSLRGVSQGGPFFHDNRAATLEEVFAKQKHGLREPLSEGELGDLIAFLRGL